MFHLEDRITSGKVYFSQQIYKALTQLKRARLEKNNIYRYPFVQQQTLVECYFSISILSNLIIKYKFANFQRI